MCSPKNSAESSAAATEAKNQKRVVVGSPIRDGKRSNTTTTIAAAAIRQGKAYCSVVSARGMRRMPASVSIGTQMTAPVRILKIRVRVCDSEGMGTYAPNESTATYIIEIRARPPKTYSPIPEAGPASSRKVTSNIATSVDRCCKDLERMKDKSSMICLVPRFNRNPKLLSIQR
jgi:hypothetical protein